MIGLPLRLPLSSSVFLVLELILSYFTFVDERGLAVRNNKLACFIVAGVVFVDAATVKVDESLMADVAIYDRVFAVISGSNV